MIIIIERIMISFFQVQDYFFNKIRLYTHTNLIVLFVLPFRNLFERVKVIRATRHAIIAHSAYIQRADVATHDKHLEY